MVAAAAISAFLPAASSSLDFSGKCSASIGGSSLRLKSKSKSGDLRINASALTPPQINGHKADVRTNNTRDDDATSSLPARTFINQLPDWSMLLAAVTTIFLAAEKQWMMLDSKPKRSDMPFDPFNFGQIVHNGFVFRQNFSIRSYEIGADRSASIETVMNHLQESALNHVKTVGLLGEGFGSTPEMSKKKLIWVVAKMQVLVDRYPTWGDVVQVDTWVSPSGKNGLRRDWVIRDSNTGDVLITASSVWVIMHKITRKISKMPDEVRGEIRRYFMDVAPVVEMDNRKLTKLDDATADHVCTGLTPRWSDLDVNQHVNNVKYIGWILESAPEHLLESHELSRLTLEYRRECGKESVLQSLTAVSEGCENLGKMECQHLLRLETGPEIVKGRTQWRPKCASAHSA